MAVPVMGAVIAGLLCATIRTNEGLPLLETALVRPEMPAVLPVRGVLFANNIYATYKFNTKLPRGVSVLSFGKLRLIVIVYMTNLGCVFYK
jgi:hypothetical protein